MNKLERKRALLLEKLSKYGYFVKGSISTVCMACSRAHCICKTPKGKKSYRLTYKDEGQKTRIIYISKGRLKEVRKMISNYKKYREITQDILNINVEIFREGGQN